MQQPSHDDQAPAHLSTHAPPSSRIPPFVIKAVTIASLGGILFGYDMGVVSGALPQLKSSFDLTRAQQEMVVSFLYLGGGLGAAVGGSICDSMGRKSAILVTDAVFVVGASLLYFSWNLPSVLVGRIVVGFGVSVSGVADVAYLHEISPSEWRGSVVSVNEACISLGFLLAYVAGYGIGLLDPEEGWRALFGLGAPVALVQFLGMLAMPESPVWLKEQGKFHEADAALKTIQGGTGWFGTINDSKEETTNKGLNDQAVSSACQLGKLEFGETSGSCLAHPTSSEKLSGCALSTHTTKSNEGYQSTGSSVPFMVSHSSLDSEDSSPTPTVFSCLRSLRMNLYQLRHEVTTHYQQATIAVFLSITQQFCGHPNVLNYAPEIFRQVGLASRRSSLGATLLIGVIKFSATCAVIWKIEYLGRRFLLLAGMSTIAFSLSLLSIAFAGDMDSESMSTGWVYIAILGVFGVALGYAASFGPLTWLLTSEMFPTAVRGRALGASTIVTYLSASIVSYTFLSGQDVFGPSVPFAIYCVITLASVAFAYLAIPDTGGKSPEEIEVDLRKMWWWRSSWGTLGLRKKDSQTDLTRMNGTRNMSTYAAMDESSQSRQDETSQSRMRIV